MNHTFNPCKPELNSIAIEKWQDKFSILKLSNEEY